MAHHSNQGASVCDWRTPKPILELVRTVFGGPIDFDPCSGHDNPTQANTFLTKDGLETSWEGYGNMFVNPPWRKRGMPVVWWMAPIWDFATKHPEQPIITICAASTNSAWFHDFVVPAAAHCVPRGRIAYDTPPHYVEATAPSFDTCFAYWGPDPELFEDTFRHLGRVVHFT